MEIGPRKSFQRPPSVHANRGSIGSVLAIRRVDVRGGRMGLPREGGVQGHLWVKLSLCPGDFTLKERAKGRPCWLADYESK